MGIIIRGGIAMLFLLSGLCVNAQSPHNYWGDKDGFMKEQSSETFKLIQELLAKEPPSAQIGLLRRSALLHMDWVLHDVRLDNSETIRAFLQSRIAMVVEDMKRPVKKGIRVYKLYNHSFIVKTKSVTVAFDIVKGGKDKSVLIPDSLMQEVVNGCDVLLISHEHTDHADVEVGRMFAKAGKPIIAPPSVWADEAGVTHLRSSDILQDRINLTSNRYIDLKIYPGYQGKVLNNVYRVRTPEGMTVAHTGDMSNSAMNAWIDRNEEEGRTDVLLLHSWARPVIPFVTKFRPRVLITGHENELHHSIDHREPYWLNYRRMEGVNTPIVYMTWGEWFSVQR
ncbi:MBL fold metallo-hydrolase [Sphingobacterium paucimobilis]|uniref:Metallo-beta-lactamase domain-containing protein n=1 Tax=Sphingobacterium paucimobilis HER1398 TaxID=1346330 RepID=U2IZ42_9SPHI|nr:MBL fold metallo-hydrolase [Sphingobacterium paucimobilis]ERJ57969.1 hypothetical protein M472_04235 [Sphingobacterium paucimobilis HER1398]